METTKATPQSANSTPAEPFSYPTDTSPAAKRAYRMSGLGNLMKMGHCAPAVMQTMLDASHTRQEWLVKLAAGMPGGIGNTGFECGGVTSPLILLGLRYGLNSEDHGLPQIFDKGCDHCARFAGCHKTLNCREIRGKARLPLKCIPVVMRSSEYLVGATAGDSSSAIPQDKREAYRRLYIHLSGAEFHCAHAVLRQLSDIVPLSQQLLDATSAFLGGTLFQGRTCSAYAAGVMAIGLMTGEIEDSTPRVLRMIAMMGLGANAFADDVNKFNKSMNTGYRLSKWFRKEFGSTQCREITGCDFSTSEGVDQYIESNSVNRCKLIAEKVAMKVREILTA